MALLNSSGAVVAHYEYDAFGDTFVASGTYAATNEYRFSTKPLDATSGLYYYGLRYYNPSAGRWLSRDPLNEQGGLNLYAFCKNVSVNGVDYLGMSFIGDVLSILTDPVKYWKDEGEEYLTKRFPALKIPLLMAELGESIATSIQNELKYTNLLRGLSLTLDDLKKIDDCLLTSGCGTGGILNSPARDFDCCLVKLQYTNTMGYATANALSGLPRGVSNGVYNFVKNKAIDLISKKLIDTMFPHPHEDALPESFEDTVEDSGKWLAEVMQDKIKTLTDQ